MSIALETLELVPEELSVVKDQVRKLAYEKWEGSGRPWGGELGFWLKAEREWIERDYAPHRDDLSRP